MRLMILRKHYVRVVAGIITASVFVWPTMAVANTAAIPDFSGLWARQSFDFEPLPFGPGPVAKAKRPPGSQPATVGDHTNPILRPEAAEIIKKRGENELRNVVAPTPYNQCAPMSPPFILGLQQIQLLQLKDQVVILYPWDHQVRHIRMNANHPAQVTQTWQGDSIGHYEGDTLVIDTIGMKKGPFSMADHFGTPQDEALHVVERYRLIDYQTAKETTERYEAYRRAGVLTEGVTIDPDYRGKGLQVLFTVEDSGVFTMPWSASVTYLRAAGEWPESVCAENLRESTGADRKVPTAEKPDF